MLWSLIYSLFEIYAPVITILPHYGSCNTEYNNVIETLLELEVQFRAHILELIFKDPTGQYCWVKAMLWSLNSCSQSLKYMLLP